MALFKANLNFRGIDRDEIVDIADTDLPNWEKAIEKGWITRWFDPNEIVVESTGPNAPGLQQPNTPTNDDDLRDEDDDEVA